MTDVAAAGAHDRPTGFRQVSEVRADLPIPLWVHPEWSQDHRWLIHGTTGRGSAEPFDLGIFGNQRSGDAWARWSHLRQSLSVDQAILAHQVHGARVLHHHQQLPAGLLLADAADGHLTDLTGVLIAVAVADCVPVSLVDPDRRAVAIVHAGWRGVASDILERAVSLMGDRFDSDPATLLMHCGPSICGVCYEVGPEVHAAVLPGESPPEQPSPIDLRAALAARAANLGVRANNITVSGHCTRCGPADFFSHRGGQSERQIGLLARRS